MFVHALGSQDIKTKEVLATQQIFKDKGYVIINTSMGFITPFSRRNSTIAVVEACSHTTGDSVLLHRNWAI